MFYQKRQLVSQINYVQHQNFSFRSVINLVKKSCIKFKNKLNFKKKSRNVRKLNFCSHIPVKISPSKTSMDTIENSLLLLKSQFFLV